MRNRWPDIAVSQQDDRAAYMREFRKRNRESAERGARRGRANGRALWRLARMHPDEFDALVAEELAVEEGRAS